MFIIEKKEHNDNGWKPSWGGHRGSGETRATIGEGLLNIGAGVLNAGSGVLNAGANAGAGILNAGLNAGAKAGAGIYNAGLNAGSSIYNAGLNAGSGIYDWLGAQFGGGTGQGQHGAGGSGGAAGQHGTGGAAGQHGTGRASYGECTDNSGTCDGSTGQGGVGSNKYSGAGGSSGHSYSGLNRDINHAQTWTQHYNIQAIEAYISTTDRAALLKSLPKHSDGTIDWPAITQSIGTTIQSEVKATFRDLADMFGVNGQKQDQITLEEIIQKLAEEADDAKKEAADSEKQADDMKADAKQTGDAASAKQQAATGYISEELTTQLLNQDLLLVTRLKKNMKNKLLLLQDKFLLYKRTIVETIFGKLKMFQKLWHSRFRAVENAFCNLMACLISYLPINLLLSQPLSSYP